MKNSYSLFLLFLSAFITFTAPSWGQVPTNLIGSNYPGLKWNQIETDQFKIIFPGSIDSSAQRVARIIISLNEINDSSIGKERLKIPILIHSQAANSNGLVTVGPFRSEFFPTQRQFGNATNYLDLLTIHEYRHAQQFANATKGITKVVKNVLGSWAWGGMMATALPRWYYEGDAVIAESQFTKSGRGRLPAFNMEYHALFHDQKEYSYEKASAGSIKDFVPNWYPLGYNMLTYGTQKFGEELWPKVTDDAVRYKGIFYPFSRSLKKHTGLSTPQLYDAAFDELKKEYAERISNLDLTNFDYLEGQSSKVVTHYSNPKSYKNGVLAIKAAFDGLPTIVYKDGEKEKKVVEIGRQIEGLNATFSISNDVIVWSQFNFDFRWRYRQYTDIYTYHIPTRVKTRVTKNSRYQSPALNKEASQIAAISINENLSPSLHIISVESQEVLYELENQKYGQLSHPCWAGEESVVLVATRSEMSVLVKINLSKNVWEEISNPTSHQLSFPIVRHGAVYYSSSYSGINNIFKISAKTKEVLKYTEVPIGAFQPEISQDGEFLYYRELESNGNRIKKLNIAETSGSIYPLEDESIEKEDLKYFNYSSVMDNLVDTSFSITKFNKWSGILMPHSLLPEFNHPEASLRLLSDNVFSTMSGEGGASYNYNEDEWSYFIGFRYAELFPIINASFVQGYRSSQFLNFRPYSDSTSIFTVFNQRWRENRMLLGVSLPFNLSKGNLSSSVQLSANYQLSNLKVSSSLYEPNNFRDTVSTTEAVLNFYDSPIRNSSISTFDVRLRASMIKRLSRLQVKPRFGGSFSIRFRNQLGNQLNGGDVLNVDGALFLPGIIRTHSLYFETSFQKESVLDNYRYSDIFNYPRGYDASFRRDQFFKFGINYAMPLWYPDAALSSLAFIKRVKANLFYDYGQVALKNPVFNTDVSRMQSIGVELGLDLRAFRLVEVDFGLRYSYLFDPDLSVNGNRHQFDFFVISITE